jgi:hypothetical protein
MAGKGPGIGKRDEGEDGEDGEDGDEEGDKCIALHLSRALAASL